MVSFEIFVKAMPPSLSELKVLSSFCFAFKIPDDVTATTTDILGKFIWRSMFHHERISNSNATFVITVSFKSDSTSRKKGI